MKITQQAFSTLAGPRKLEQPVILVLTPKQSKAPGRLGMLPDSIRKRVSGALGRLSEPLAAGKILRAAGTHPGEPDLVIGAVPEPAGSFELLGFARACLKEGLQSRDTVLAIGVLDPEFEQAAFECFGAAVAARIWAIPLYGRKAKKAKPFKLGQVQLLGESDASRNRFERGFVAGNGTNLVRHLGMLPPNELSTRTYGSYVRRYAREGRLQLKFYSKDQLRRMGAGAFTAVDRADPLSGGGIYELTYSPRSARNRAPVALVGKGLCFDTGGYDVKVGSGMVTMKGDMQGSAVALATVLTAARLKLPVRLKAYLAVTANHISPHGYTADEVVTALNGMSIEVVNTDAEGRMVLADALALASRGKPEMIVDFATLTGSAMRAIGTGYGAAFSNREALHQTIRAAGEESGERVWPFPIIKSYAKQLESPVADIKQCVRGGSPDHIMAAYFLSQFVEETIPWVHLDLAAAECEGGLAHVDTLFTGFGVLWAIRFLESSVLGR